MLGEGRGTVKARAETQIVKFISINTFIMNINYKFGVDRFSYCVPRVTVLTFRPLDDRVISQPALGFPPVTDSGISVGKSGGSKLVSI